MNTTDHETTSDPADELGLAFEIDGKQYRVPDRFKIGELRTIKRMTGRHVEDLEMSDPETMAALTLVLKQREDPNFTEEMLDDMTFRYVNPSEPGADADPPAQAEATTTGVPS